MTKQIKHEQIAHIITKQNSLEQAMLAEFAAGTYTIANPLVKLNPYGVCPLTAMVLFETPVMTEATIVVKGKEHPGDIRHTFPAGTKHILPVYGLYADYENTVEIVMANGQKNTIHIQTAPIHPDVPLPTSIKTTPEYMGHNLMFLTAAMRSMPVGYDYAGDVRWYSNENFAFDLKRIPNGHILIGTERLVKMPYFTTGLYEMAFSGKIFKEYRTPSGYHHDQFVMEDGNILVLSFDFYSGTVEDMCLLIDPNTGEVLKSWDYKNVLPQNVAGSGSQDEHDWFHNNAVWYDKKTHSLTFSGRHQDAVINLDFETGKLNWILGDPEGWPQEMVDKYFFTPVGDGEFDWQYEQHASVVLPDGDIMLFDNGHFRAKNKKNYLANSKNFSRGVRYRLDTEKMTIQQIWQYGKERGAEFFSPYICNVEYYNEGHYMVHSGGIGYENGETCEGMAVMKVMQPEFKDSITFNSITCELKDDVLMYELQVPANCYRAEKLPLYYAHETAELGAGKLLGNLIETETTKMKIKAQETGELVPEHYEASIIEEEDRLTFNAIFETGEMAQLLLVDEAGEVRRYPINTVAQNFQAMCVGTFQKADPRNVDVFINKTGLSGNYQVMLVAEEKLYETGVTISA
ncbi:aryl-sulfate sulfotransferase [Desulfosporosinus meridiei]|uniref:Arylsulfotransferase (ASST) n=1 Tax=Desulfosporosinus meridiei (strain ATCC BAA-275 / DSM 13257 / KCTC 12902 / NCIMB 13706 / S10) TaxID=768704 RepID=J7IPV4_DESMD|nr:aryl-sulfate sulfotransferase [Desulfosporosinus meridiei]AFQ43862.1 Arylsulfotransferase (ASST) [Desulfosporosinus meridiei DSM 13257]